MYTITVLLIVFIISMVYGIIEFFLHQKRIYSIPVRIHVNGTRGKSSVTRLIGAGLRQGGIKTITKVTGTYPRLILEDGSEARIFRKAEANIIEQLSIVKLAAERKAQAVVIECMAIQPQYQWITEKQMIHSTIGLITNVRPDHTDAMGYTLPEIAEALGKTIPGNQHLFTSEDQMLDKIEEMCKRQKAALHFADASSVTDEEIRRFNYIEHKENVALALSVCEHIGIDRNTALLGMQYSTPDSGALKLLRVEAYRKSLYFYNAFAANDPQSTFMIWKKIERENGFKGVKIILLNTRQDRLDRARQLTAMIGTKINNEFDFLFLIGQSAEVVEDLAAGSGIGRNKIINLGLTKPESVFEAILTYTDKESTIIAMGNMGGMGGKVVEFFENRNFANG